MVVVCVGVRVFHQCLVQSFHHRFIAAHTSHGYNRARLAPSQSNSSPMSVVQLLHAALSPVRLLSAANTDAAAAASASSHRGCHRASPKPQSRSPVARHRTRQGDKQTLLSHTSHLLANVTKRKRCVTPPASTTTITPSCVMRR